MKALIVDVIVKIVVNAKALENAKADQVGVKVGARNRATNHVIDVNAVKSIEQVGKSDRDIVKNTTKVKTIM